MPQMAPAYSADTLGDLEDRTAYNQTTFLPLELPILLKEWKFGSVGRVKGWVVGASLGADAGGPEWGEHIRTRLSGFGLWSWGLLKTTLSGWPNACITYLGVQKILNGEQQQGKWV